MGLKPIPNGHVQSITVGDSTYELREMVSVADLDKTNTLLMESYSWLERAEKMQGDFVSGADIQFSEIERAVQRSKQAMNEMVKLWLAAWSHPDEVTLVNIARLETPDRKAIGEYIRDRIRRTNEDEANPTPQDAPSIGVSEPSS